MGAPVFTRSNLTLIAHTVSALPVSPAAALYINPANNVMKTMNNSGRVTTYSPETTKGDATVYNGTTQVRLPVGTNESLLIADIGDAVVAHVPIGVPEPDRQHLCPYLRTTFFTKPKSRLMTTSLFSENYMVGVKYNHKVSNYIYNVEITALMDGSVWHDNERHMYHSRALSWFPIGTC